MTKYWILILVFATTLILQPWRNSVSQDDAAYSFSAISVAHGDGHFHAGMVAMSWPQILSGAGVLKVTQPFLENLRALNFLTWVLFLAMAGIFAFCLRGRPWLLLAFLAAPTWIQYAASYLTEIYSAFLLVGLIWTLQRDEKFNRTGGRPGFGGRALACGAAFLLAVQVQHMAAFPFFWGLGLGIQRRQWKLGVGLMASAVAGAGLFLLVGKLPFQDAYAYWLVQEWIEKGSRTPVVFGTLLVEHFLALGLFLIPTLKFEDVRKRSGVIGVVIQVCVIGLFKITETPPLAAGVLFLDYLPAWVGWVFLSMGTWGLFGLWELIRRHRHQEWPTFAALGMILIFTVFRLAADIRYIMTCAVPILILLVKNEPRGRRLGDLPAYGLAVLFASVFFNLYNLNTSAARWDLARSLEAKGIDPTQISAGFGRDAFVMEDSCIRAAIAKLETTEAPPVIKTEAFRNRIIHQWGRSYSDGWVPRFVIKPSRAFGRDLNLKKNRVVGQEQEPIDRINYSVLGLSNQLAVFENANPQPAWCFR